MHVLFLSRRARRKRTVVIYGNDRTSEQQRRSHQLKVASTREGRRCPLGHDSRPPARRPRRLGPPSPVRPSSDCASHATSPPASPAAQEYCCGTARPAPCGGTLASTRWVHMRWWWRRAGSVLPRGAHRWRRTRRGAGGRGAL